MNGERAAADVAIGHKLLGGDTGVDDQFATLPAKWAQDSFRDFHEVTIRQLRRRSVLFSFRIVEISARHLPPFSTRRTRLAVLDSLAENATMNRLLLPFILLAATAAISLASEGVILLHGLCRTDDSMARMASALKKEGFVVVNVDYPSRASNVEELAEQTISETLRDPKLAGVDKVHFVTHSMGGILVRQYLKTNQVARLGRVVMLGPPNQGSELVDKLGDLALFEKINGPAGKQLGTGPNSVPNQLGPVGFELGVIAGDRSINWINSRMIDGPDDGKVSVQRTKVSGMKDHLVIHASHPYIMRNDEAIRETIQFLRHGRFSSKNEKR
jgi:triacylglycerol lipase